MIEFEKTKVNGLFIGKISAFKDKRGTFKRIFSKDIFSSKLKINIKQANICENPLKGTFRGLHFQIKKPQAKFISVAYGKVFDVVIDLRKKSKTFGKKFEIILDSKKNTSLYIPEGFAHGFKSLENDSIMIYACSNKRYPKLERGIIWNDKNLKINWPNKNKNFVSSKDEKNITFEEFKKNNKF